MKPAITDEELKRLESYPFWIEIFASHLDPNAEKILKELKAVEELKDVKKIPLFDTYIMLRLLGLKYLAYILETPPRKPWNKTTKYIHQQCGTINYYITIPSWVLDARLVKKKK